MTHAGKYTADDIDAIPQLSPFITSLDDKSFTFLQAHGLVELKYVAEATTFDDLHENLFYIHYKLSITNGKDDSGLAVYLEGVCGFPCRIVQKVIFDDYGGAPGILLTFGKFGLFKTRLASLIAKDLYNPIE